MNIFVRFLVTAVILMLIPSVPVKAEVGNSWNFSLPAESVAQKDSVAAPAVAPVAGTAPAQAPASAPDSVPASAPATATAPDPVPATDAEPQSFEAYDRRGTAKMQAGNRDGAVADFSKAIELDPQLAGAFFQKAGAKGQQAVDNRMALDDYRRLTGLDSGYVFAFDNRGLMKYIGGDYRGAIADFSAAIVIDPENPLPYKHRGYARHDLRDYDGAISDYSKALELDPKAGDVYRNRALARKQSGDEDGALADLKDAAMLGDKSARKMLRARGINIEDASS